MSEALPRDPTGARFTLRSGDAVADTPVDAVTDLRTPRRLADLDLDTAYGDIARDGDGRTVEVWADAGFSYLQVFTTERYPGHDLAVAIEPMTAPADALNSGRDLRWLTPGEKWTLSWGVEYRGA